MKYDVLFLNKDDKTPASVEADYALVNENGALEFYKHSEPPGGATLVAAFFAWCYFYEKSDPVPTPSAE